MQLTIIGDTLHQGDNMVVVPTFGGGEPEEEIRVIIKDLEPKPKFLLSLPRSTTVAQLYREVSSKRKYPAVLKNWAVHT